MGNSSQGMGVSGSRQDVGYGGTIISEVEGSSETRSEVEADKSSGSPVRHSDVAKLVDSVILFSVIFPSVVSLSLEDTVIETSSTSGVGVGS